MSRITWLLCISTLLAMPACGDDDGGTGDPDTGPIRVDGGPGPIDMGGDRRDGGPGPSDAGPGPEDGGPGPEDGGPEPEDGAPQDGGPGPACPPGQEMFFPGCGDPSDGHVVITPGCYQPCSGSLDRSCGAGTTCQRSDINPCVCPPGEGCCAACGAEQWLCLAGSTASGPYELESLDASCEGVITGQQVLDSIVASYTGTLSYFPLPEGRSTRITITTAYEGGTLSCHPAVFAPPGSDAPDLPPHLEVTVAMTITTEDGQFAEAFTTPLDAWIPGMASFDASFPLAELMGSYDPMRPDLMEPAVRVGGDLMGARSTGTIFFGGMRGPGVGETTGVGSWTTD